MLAQVLFHVIVWLVFYSLIGDTMNISEFEFGVQFSGITVCYLI